MEGNTVDNFDCWGYMIFLDISGQMGYVYGIVI